MNDCSLADKRCTSNFATSNNSYQTHRILEIDALKVRQAAKSAISQISLLGPAELHQDILHFFTVHPLTKSRPILVHGY